MKKNSWKLLNDKYLVNISYNVIIITYKIKNVNTILVKALFSFN
jgi:hypothetical protein